MMNQSGSCQMQSRRNPADKMVPSINQLDQPESGHPIKKMQPRRSPADKIVPSINQCFNFEELITELQEIILIKAAVSLRLSSDSFRDVFHKLGSVCTRWREFTKDKRIIEKIKQQAFLQDPMCRYLPTSQSISIVGFKNKQKYVICAVTLGDVLYVTEFTPTDQNNHVFMYDIDDTNVRSKKKSEKKITFSNKRPLVIKGLFSSVELLVPCTYTDCLYALEYNVDAESGKIYKLKPDGTVLLSWIPHLVGNAHIDEIVLNTAGTYISYTTGGSVFMYSTATGAPVDEVQVQSENEMNNAVTIKYDKRCTTIKSTATFPGLSFQSRRVHVIDDHGCEVRMGQSHMTLCDLCTKRERELRGVITTRLPSSFFWFDKARGLIICTDVKSLRVFRVAH